MFIFNIIINVTKSASSISGDRKKKQKPEIGSQEVHKYQQVKVIVCLILFKALAYIADKYFN